MSIAASATGGLVSARTGAAGAGATGATTGAGAGVETTAAGAGAGAGAGAVAIAACGVGRANQIPNPINIAATTVPAPAQIIGAGIFFPMTVEYSITGD